MKFIWRFAVSPASIFALLAVLTSLSIISAYAQNDQGQNGICTSSTGCTTLIPSPAFIDASAFCSGSSCSGDDFCTTVNSALARLSVLSPDGGVVDARGINSGGSNACTKTTLYTGISTPSTLLLPSGEITISETWVLPDRTRIIGQGNNPSNANPLGTYIVASGIAPGDAMIEMGNSSCNDPNGSGQCYGISIENLMLNGANGGTQSDAIDGIWNFNAGESSYVDHVNFSQIAGTGIKVGGNATGSGPYSNLAMSPAGLCAQATSCVKLGDAIGGIPLSTRGIHSLTCTCKGSQATGGTGTAGIMLNSPNNTLEDIHFEGFINGVMVGNLAPTSATINTRNNVIKNVNGGGNPIDTMTNVVRICGLNANSVCVVNGGTATACGNSNNVVSDLTMEAVLATRTSVSYPIETVVCDDLTGTTIPSQNQSVTSVAKYVLGDAMSGGYSRFATNPVAAVTGVPPVPTWDVGTSVPTSSCESGSLFSNINGQTGGGTGKNSYTLYVCSSSVWKPITK